MATPRRISRAYLPLLGAALVLAACASTTKNPSYEEGMALVSQGRHEQGLVKLEQAVREEPDNARYRLDLVNVRTNHVNRLIADAQRERTQGRLATARELYEKARLADPGSERVKQGLDELRRDERHVEAVKLARAAFEKGDLEGAMARVQPVLAENPTNPPALELKARIEEKRIRELMAAPRLESAFRRPVDLRFQDTAIRMVFDALSRSTGINYILDKDIRPDLRTTIFSRGAPLEDAIDLILMTNQLEKKILNATTILIYPATPQKLKEYQELVVKAFYLSGSDVKQAQALLKSMLKIREVFIDEKLRLLVIRDTPEAIRVAEKVIALHDLGEAEVMLELEVLEVRRSRLLELGINWPDQLAFTPLPRTGSTLTVGDLANLSPSRIGVGVSSTILNLRKQDGDVNLLANPRVRAKNREKAKVLIGERVPSVTSTVTSTGLISQSVQYQDVGLKLEIEPDILVDNEIVIKVALEVSAITREIVTTGILTYQIGTRNAATALKLKDGETQILAGLINDEDRRAASRVPGIGELPILSRLFGSQRDDNQKTEIVLSITPRLVRGLTRPDYAASEFWSGTETTLRTRPLTLGTTQVAAAGTLAPKPPATVTGATSQALLSWRAPESVKVGQEFKVDLIVKTEGLLRSLPMQIAFDAAALRVVDVQEGAYFKQGGGKTSFAHNIDQAKGRLFVGTNRVGSEGVKGGDTLVSIVFRAKTAKPKVEVTVLSATPVASGTGAIIAVLPSPQVLNVTQ